MSDDMASNVRQLPAAAVALRRHGGMFLCRWTIALGHFGAPARILDPLKCAEQEVRLQRPLAKGLHSSTFQLNVRTFLLGAFGGFGAKKAWVDLRSGRV